MHKKWLTRIGILVGFLVALVLVAVLTQSIIATQKLKSILRQFEKDSIPVSWEEFCNSIPNWEARRAAQTQLFSALDDLANLPDLSYEEKEILPVEGYAELPEIGNNNSLL